MSANKQLCSIVIILALSAGGCASAKAARIAKSLSLSQNQNHYIPEVPFIKQRKNFCGPAAVASVLNYWGKDVSQDDVAKAIYSASAKGTLNIDFAGYVIKHGLWAQEYDSDFDGLKPFLRANIPVVVLQEMGIAPFIKYHYSVLIGYDDAKKFVLVHSASIPNRKIRYRSFRSSFKHAGNWALIVAPPEDVNWDLNSEQHNRLGNLCERIGRLDLAILHYKEVMAGLPDEPSGYFNAGNIYLKKGDYGEAANYFKKAIALSPANGDYYNNLACAELEAGRLRDAERNAAKALSLNPAGRSYYLDTQAMIYFKKGLYDEAISALKEARLSAGEDREVLNTIDEHMKLISDKKPPEGK